MDNSIVHLILHAAPCKYEKKPPPINELQGKQLSSNEVAKIVHIVVCGLISMSYKECSPFFLDVISYTP